MVVYGRFFLDPFGGTVDIFFCVGFNVVDLVVFFVQFFIRRCFPAKRGGRGVITVSGERRRSVGTCLLVSV